MVKKTEDLSSIALFAIETASDTVLWVDQKANIIYSNEAASRILGYTKEEFQKIKVQDIDPTYAKLDWDERWQNLRNIKVFSGESQHLTKDGKIIPVELSCSWFQYLGKEYNCVFAKDLSKSKILENELIDAKENAEESDKLKTAFLATMSHELRTPLNAIIGFSDLINDSKSIKKIHNYSKIIFKSGEHLISIIEDVFDISAIESGKITIRKEEFNLIQTLNEINDIINYEKRNQEKDNIEVNYINPDNLDNFPINTDRNRFKQILINLLKNSLKFTDEGSIEFSYSVKDTNILFYVRDTGIGIPEDKKEIIFDRFRQVDDSHTRSVGGTGLGLSICKKLVELLGGELWVESIEKKGSTFSFTLPYNGKKSHIKKKKIIEKLIIPDLSDKTILIVEDVETNFQFIEVSLQRTGANILWAENAKQSIEICDKNKNVDLVLMDINLPGMNGLEATEIIKKNRKNLPIIAQTAYALKGDREKILRAGCNNYISKPIKRNELISVISKHI